MWSLDETLDISFNTVYFSSYLILFIIVYDDLILWLEGPGLGGGLGLPRAAEGAPPGPRPGAGLAVPPAGAETPPPPAQTAPDNHSERTAKICLSPLIIELRLNVNISCMVFLRGERSTFFNVHCKK